MTFKQYLNFINEGGNLVISRNNREYASDKIDLKKFKISELREEFYNLLKNLNTQYKNTFKDPLFDDLNALKNGTLYNGSSNFILNQELDPKEILKFKKHAGDIDVMISKEKMSNLWNLLHTLENKKIENFTYIGNNRNSSDKIGTQINCIFVYDKLDIKCQIDFEGVEFEKGYPTEWSKFSHSSSFEDVKNNIKGLHHKLLLRAIVGAISEDPSVVIATPSSTFDKISLKKTSETPRMAQFSVDHGLGFGLEPIVDEKGNIAILDGKKVFKETKSTNKKYIKDLSEIFFYLFKTHENLDKFKSFIGVVHLMKLHCSKEVQENTRKRYFQILFGKGAQIIESYDPEADKNVKLAGYEYFLKELNLKHPNLKKAVDQFYIDNKSRFR